MDFLAEINACWADHNKDAAGVEHRLRELVTQTSSTAERVAWSKVWTHVVGFEQNRPLDALEVIDELTHRLDAVEDASILADAYLLATILGHDVTPRLVTLLQWDPDNFAAWVTRAAALRAEHRVDQGSFDGLGDLHQAVRASDAMPPGHVGERAIAVSTNNAVSIAVENDKLTQEQLHTLLPLATASRRYWQRVGTPLNDARGAYLVQLAANHCKDVDHATQGADEALAILDTLNDVDDDRAFVLLSRAYTARLANCDWSVDLGAADMLAMGWADGLLKWYTDTRQRYFGA